MDGRWLLALLLCVSSVHAEAEPDSPCAPCDAKYPVSFQDPAVTFCDTNRTTRTSSLGALVCYFHECNLGALYNGPCGCPNNCTGGLRGACDSTQNVCRCGPGWTGEDCNLVDCAANNTCSGHGVCTDGMCSCTAGWGGPACDVPVARYGDTPWGCPMPRRFANVSCKEPDALLPWMDFSGLPQIHLEIGSAELASLFDPAQAYSQDYRPSNVTWISTRLGRRKRLVGAGVRIKGSTSRVAPKKSFKFDFSNVTDAVWPKLNLKSALNLIGSQYITSMLMTAGVPALRSFFAVLYINSRFYGIFTAFGDFTQDFRTHFYGGDQTTWYKAGFYIKPMAAAPLSILKPQPLNDSAYVRDAEWLATASTADFNANVTQVLDIDSFARCTAVASFVQLGDTFVPAGNNYQWAYSRELDVPWSITMRDFDGIFSPNVVPEIGLFLLNAPLGRRLMTCPAFVAVFKKRYTELLGLMFNQPPGAAPSPQEWYMSFVDYLGLYAQLDGGMVLFHGPGYSIAETALQDTSAFAARLSSVVSQLSWL